MNFRDQLAAQKREGEREFAEKQQEALEREEQAAAKKRHEEERLRAVESEKDRRKAETVFAGMPGLVRQAAQNGLKAAILLEGFVEERPGDEKPYRTLVQDRRTYYLTGWQVPFYDMCKENGIPLTVVSERVEGGLKRMLRRDYHVLAIDLTSL